MKSIKIKNTQESNFNILLLPCNYADNKTIDFLDTIVCDDTLKCKFDITILYSILSKEELSSLNLRLFLKYLPDGENQKSVYQEIINDTFNIGKRNDDSSSQNKKSKKELQVNLPKGIQTQESGKYIIRYSTKMFSYGDYQFELYYRFNNSEEYTLATIQPLTIVPQSND